MSTTRKIKWEELENRYVADSKETFVSLARKSGRTVKEISKYAADHNWRQKREIKKEVQSATGRDDGPPVEDRQGRLLDLADKLLDKVGATVSLIDPMDTSSIRQIADTLRIVKDITAKEQTKDTTISVVLDESLKRLAK